MVLVLIWVNFALGKNVVVAFTTFNGYNYEDAVIMNERLEMMFILLYILKIMNYNVVILNLVLKKLLEIFLMLEKKLEKES